MVNNQEIELWTSLRNKSKFIENGMEPLARKRTGSYYTDIELTDAMMDELVQKLVKYRKKIVNYRFFEPCVGSGNFVFSYIKAINKLGISKDDAVKLLNNIYVSDINKDVLDEYKVSLKKLALIYWEITLTDSYFEEHIGY